MIRNYASFLYSLQEGLIQTYDINYSLKRVRILLDWFNISKCELEKNEQTNDFQIYIDEKISRNFLEELHKLLVTLGYFITSMKYDNNKMIYDLDSALKLNFDKIKKYYFQVERKFDEDIKYNGILFHVTPNRKLNKILKIGICPKSGNKKSAHPDRIYLCYNRYQVDTLLKLLKEYENIDYTILEIRVEQLKIFNDPQSDGCYTMENINKDKIVIMYHEDWNVKKPTH